MHDHHLAHTPTPPHAIASPYTHSSMADILKHRTNLPLPDLLPEQQILNPRQHHSVPRLPNTTTALATPTIVNHMIPRARIPIHHRLTPHHLPSIHPITPLTSKRIMRIAPRVRPILEQFPQTVQREMPLHVLRAVHHARRQRLLVACLWKIFSSIVPVAMNR